MIAGGPAVVRHVRLLAVSSSSGAMAAGRSASPMASIGVRGSVST